MSDRIRAVQADADQLATVVEPAGADLVLHHHVVQDVDDPDRSLAAAAGALRPGGLLSLLVPGRFSTVLGEALAGSSALLSHVHSLALEWQLTERLQSRIALDPVLPPLVQALIASPEPATAELAMQFLAAQARTKRWRINDDGCRYALATSAQPCCQCYGASFWAGIDELLIGARSSDVMELSEFDEGPLPADWIGELARRGIAVRRDILRDEARSVLAAYGARGASY